MHSEGPPVRHPAPGGLIRVAGLASHRGTNLRHIVRECNAGDIKAELTLLISNNSGAPILSYADANGIASRHLSAKTHPVPELLDEAILDSLRAFDIDYVVLSGYMKRLGPKIVAAFPNRILNIHPSLLPRHGGQGMYGDRVYEAVLAAGDSETGATLHLVDEEYDHGPVVLQRRVQVKATDTVENLRGRVREAERRLCIEAMTKLGEGALDLDAIANRERLVASHSRS